LKPVEVKVRKSKEQVLVIEAHLLIHIVLEHRNELVLVEDGQMGSISSHIAQRISLG
jgi:hypothetical protein